MSNNITDLTGTTWYFNQSISEIIGSYDITGFLNNADKEFSNIIGNYTVFNPRIGNVFCIYIDGGSLLIYMDQNWSSEDYRTISITGGSDATNSDLISWLYENATLLSGGGGSDMSTSVNNIFFGSSQFSSIYWGASEIEKIYLGDILIYAKGETPTQTLVPPTIALNGNELRIWDNSDGEIAESFNIYIDGVLATNASPLQLIDSSNNILQDSGSNNLLTSG